MSPSVLFFPKGHLGLRESSVQVRTRAGVQARAFPFVVILGASHSPKLREDHSLLP